MKKFQEFLDKRKGEIILNTIISVKDFWITVTGDLVRYENMDEVHAENLLKYLSGTNQFVSDKLKDRVEFFQASRNSLKKLF